MTGSESPHRYLSSEEDSARWRHLKFRPGDIVISTRSKCGTTWMQMICALLVFQGSDFPAPLWQMSPWLDALWTPVDQVIACLDAQTHRRFVKSHTPLDGIPISPRVTYIVVARHPLDMAVSLYHQGGNLDRQLMRRLTGQIEPALPASPRPGVHEWLTGWIEQDADPRMDMDSLANVVWHYSDAWNRRHEPNVILVHYSKLSDDLAGEMRRIADRLEIEVPHTIWPALISAATFASMQERADELAPGVRGIIKDRNAFFRRGSSGAGRELLTEDEFARYHTRIASMAAPDMLQWLNR